MLHTPKSCSITYALWTGQCNLTVERGCSHCKQCQEVERSGVEEQIPNDQLCLSCYARRDLGRGNLPPPPPNRRGSPSPKHSWKRCNAWLQVKENTRASNRLGKVVDNLFWSYELSLTRWTCANCTTATSIAWRTEGP